MTKQLLAITAAFGLLAGVSTAALAQTTSPAPGIHKTTGSRAAEDTHMKDKGMMKTAPAGADVEGNGAVQSQSDTTGLAPGGQKTTGSAYSTHQIMKK